MDKLRKTKIYQLVFTGLFVIPLLFLGFYKNVNFDDSFAENFRLRPRIISLAMNLKFLVIKDHFFSDIMYTRDQDWLNYLGENSIDDAQNVIPFTEGQLEAIHTKLSSIKATLYDRGIKFYLVIPPNKNTIYPDDMNRIAPKKATKSRLDQLIEFESTHSGVVVIDVRPELMEAKKTHQVFYSTDTHWNDYGSWVGYSKIINVISQDFPKIVANPIEDFDIGQRTYSGDLAVLGGKLLVEETTQTFSLQNPRAVKQNNEVLENGVKAIMSYVDELDLPVALVFRDSFYNHLYMYMSQHFSKSVSLWSFAFDYDQVDRVKPDLVIYEITERYIDQLLKLP